MVECLVWDQDAAGSSPGVAQLVEQLICNQQVGGSSPSTSSILSGVLLIDFILNIAWESSRVAKGGRL